MLHNVTVTIKYGSQEVSGVSRVTVQLQQQPITVNTRRIAY